MLKTKIKSIIDESITKTKEKIYKYKIGNVILNKDMNVRKGWKIAGLIILGMLLQAGLSNNVPKNIYTEAVAKYESATNDIDELNKKLDNTEEKYEALVKNTESYTSLTDEEKELVDSKIAEVKQATADQLEAEKKAQEIEDMRKECSKYLDIIDKPYYDMTSEERTLITQFLDTEFDKLPDELKQEYQAKYDSAKASKEEGVAKIQAEEQAKKEAEAKAEEERKAKEIADKENANAIKTAKQYLDYSGFSREGLIKQLEFEGYPTESATYAVDNCGANWNEECAETAQNYLDYSSFSRDGLYNQLQFEGFTDEQIQYGLSAVGY